MLIKLCLTILIISMLVFIPTLVLIKYDVFFKKYIRAVTKKEEKFWLILDNITLYICFCSFLTAGITLLMAIIWR